MKRLIRLIAIICSGLLLTALTPAEATSTLGRSTVGSTASGGLRADFKRGSKFVLTERGTLSQLCAYLDGNGGGTGFQRLRLALYRDRNGVPAEQVAEAQGDGAFEAFHQPAFWYCYSAAAVPLEPGAYWIMLHTGGDPGIIRYYYDGAANWYGNADTFTDGASDTFGTGGAGEGTISIRAEYFTEGEARFAGPRTVGTQVSGPMSAQFKRGSSVVLTENAELQSMNVYVDGRGGASGAQSMWVALYDDVNGEPSALVTQGFVNYFQNPIAGRTGRWFSVGGNNGPVLLTPGRYWIVIKTGGPAGVLRYYSQGTGNWRGNANAAEEPSVFFGTANPGDGTITANLVYKPANVIHHTMGRTTPGNIPSGGLSANFIRGSAFDPNNYITEGWVTALWAYMDGNGGASGSQKVKLVLYSAKDSTDAIHRLVTSNEVTIQAGRPPGWVRFAVPRTHIDFDHHHIMMFTGGTAGVARNYATNDAANWLGAAHNYAEGPRSPLFTEDPMIPGAIVLQRGTVTMSVYAEFVNADYMNQ